MSLMRTLDWDQVDEVVEEGVARRLRALRNGLRHRWGWTGVGTWGEDIEAAGAEKALAVALDEPWTARDNPDAVADVGTMNQVRWTDKTAGHLLLHPEDSDLQRHWLVTGLLPHFTIHGYVLGWEGKRREYWADRVGNGRPAFWIPQVVLTPAEVVVLGGRA